MSPFQPLSVMPSKRDSGLAADADKSRDNGYRIRNCLNNFISIKPFILRVKGGDRDIYNLHFTNCAVATTGFNKNGRHGFDGDQFSVEFHVCLTFGFQDEINFCHFFMIVSFCILTDVDLMYSGDLVVWCGKGPLAPAARALDEIYFIKICDFVILTHFYIYL